jgi:hypothetical protein
MISLTASIAAREEVFGRDRWGSLLSKFQLDFSIPRFLDLDQLSSTLPQAAPEGHIRRDNSKHHN